MPRKKEIFTKSEAGRQYEILNVSCSTTGLAGRLRNMMSFGKHKANYTFELIVLDPTASYCRLSTKFSVSTIWCILLFYALIKLPIGIREIKASGFLFANSNQFSKCPRPAEDRCHLMCYSKLFCVCEGSSHMEMAPEVNFDNYKSENFLLILQLFKGNFLNNSKCSVSDWLFDDLKLK